jgi:hypothetical protein
MAESAEAPRKPAHARPPRVRIWHAITALIVGLLLNWPMSWLCTSKLAERLPRTTDTGLRADSQWPAGMREVWTPLSTFITPERVELATKADAGEIDKMLALRMTIHEKLPHDCAMSRTMTLVSTDTVIMAESLDPRLALSTYEFTVGFPFKAMRRMQVTMYKNGIHVFADLQGAERMLLLGQSLPFMQPRWTFFTLNGLVYAAVMLSAFAGMQHFRRSLRIRRNLCTTCGYAKAEGTTVCPECGVGY